MTKIANYNFINIDNFCYKENIKFILGINYQLEGYIFSNFGNHSIIDKDGEPCASWTMNTTTGFYDAPLTRPTPTQEEDDALKVWRWDESLYQSDNTKGWLLVDQG